MKSGFVAILGRSNVGKSTLLNALLSKKVSIVTPKQQTTREDVLGILTEKDYQMIFIDTPGLFTGKTKLDSFLNKESRRSFSDADVMLYLIDAKDGLTEEDESNINKLMKFDKPLLLLINKIDDQGPNEMIELLKLLEEKYPSLKKIQLSALTNFNLKEVKEAVTSYFKDETQYYPDDMITDKDLSFMIKETVREKVLHFLKQEIPHQVAVVVKKVKEGKEIEAQVLIICEKDSQKGIIIGKKGDTIKKIGMAARQDLERQTKKHVILLTMVQVYPAWRNDPAFLAKIGYGKTSDPD